MTPAAPSLDGDVRARLVTRVRHAQLTGRVPSVTVAVGRAGEVLWHHSVGLADVEAAAPSAPGVQYRIGSVTKTFTAALVLLLAHEGRLDLDGRVEDILPVQRTGPVWLGRVTLRQLLAHCGGVQREAATDMWSSMRGPDEAALLASLSDARAVAAPGQRWHYSNLGYAVLGLLVREVTGRSCTELVDDRLVTPAGLTRTTWSPREPAAVGYRVDPYEDLAHAEPVMDQRAVGVGGQLWSTANDLVTWAHVLAGGREDVLPERLAVAMHTVTAMVDESQWSRAWGLGLILDRRDGAVVAGHTGAMPGFQAAVASDTVTRTTVVVLTNATKGVSAGPLAHDLLAAADGRPAADPDWPVAGDHPAEAGPWRVGTPCPAWLRAALGRWWSEAEETVLTWRDGTLQAAAATAPPPPHTVFRPDGEDCFVAATGPLQGERLTIARDSSGSISHLVWATYPLTRQPR